MRFFFKNFFLIILSLLFLVFGLSQISFAEDDFKNQAQEIFTGVVEQNGKLEGTDWQKFQKTDFDLYYFNLRVTAVAKTASDFKAGQVVKVLYYRGQKNISGAVPVLAEVNSVLKVWANKIDVSFTVMLASDGKAVNLISEKPKAGPALTIEYPKDLAEFEYNRVVIKGQTEAGSTLLVNGFVVSVPQSGAFEVPVYLSARRNTFSLVALGKNGGETRKTVTFVYKGANLTSQLQLEKEITLSVDQALRQETFSYFIKLKNQGSETVTDLKLLVNLPENVSLAATDPNFESASGGLVVVKITEPLQKLSERRVEIRVKVNNDAKVGNNLPIKVTVTGSNNTKTDTLAETFENAGPLIVASKGGPSVWVFVVPVLIIVYILISLGTGFLIAKHLVKRSISKG